jgi:hypothetical protein
LALPNERRKPFDKSGSGPTSLQIGLQTPHEHNEKGAFTCPKLGTSDIGTIKGVIDVANKYGKKAQIDLINVADMYAVNIVDTSHKLRNGNISWSQAQKKCR